MTSPLRLPPEPGEAWASYQARVAHALGCQPHHLPGYSRGITIKTDPAVLADWYHLASEQILAMHLQHWDGTAFRLNPSQHNLVPSAWTWQRTPRTCAFCTLEHGYSKLEWRIPWILTCPEHHIYLSNPSQPTNLEPADQPTLDQTEAFQRLLDGHPGTAAGYTKPALDVFDTWRDAATLARRTHTRPPTTSHPRHAAAMLEHLGQFVNAATPEEAAAVLNQWCQAGQLTKPYGTLLGHVSTRQAQNAIDAISSCWNRQLCNTAPR